MISGQKQDNRSPVEVHGTGRAVDTGYLADFIARATAQTAVSSEAIVEDQFDRGCDLLGDTRTAFSCAAAGQRAL